MAIMDKDTAQMQSAAYKLIELLYKGIITINEFIVYSSALDDEIKELHRHYVTRK